MPNPCPAVVNPAHVHYLNWTREFFSCAQRQPFPRKWAGRGSGERGSGQSCPTVTAPLLWARLPCRNAQSVCDKSALGLLACSWHLKNLSPLPFFKRPICHFILCALGVQHVESLKTNDINAFRRGLLSYRDTVSGRQKSQQWQKRTSYSYTTGILQSILLTAAANVSIKILQGSPTNW